MASFRDRYNPETIHFPADLTSKFLIPGGILLNVVLALACLITHQPLWRTIAEIVSLFAVSVVFLLCWPPDLRIELRGVSSRWLFGRREFIEWKDVKSAYPVTRRILGVTLEAYVVESNSGKKVVHSERHDDRERWVFELRRHGVSALDAYDD